MRLYLKDYTEIVRPTIGDVRPRPWPEATKCQPVLALALALSLEALAVALKAAAMMAFGEALD